MWGKSKFLGKIKTQTTQQCKIGMRILKKDELVERMREDDGKAKLNVIKDVIQDGKVH